MNKRIVASLLIVAAIAMLAMYFYRNYSKQNASVDNTSTPSSALTDTQDWNTYSSVLFGYSISYPKNWRIVDNVTPKGSGTVQLFNYPEDKYVGGEVFKSGDTKVEIVVMEKPTSQSLQNFVEQSSKSGMQSEAEHIYGSVSMKFIKVLTDEIKGDNSYKTYYLDLGNDKVLLLTASPSIPNSESIEIINTLRLN